MLKDINMPLIGQGVGEYVWDKTHSDIIKKGIDLGLSLVDTCEIYNDGRSEEIIGDAIQGIRKSAIVLTKFSVKNSRYLDVIKSAEGSLKRLKTDYIDIYQTHWPSSTVPFEETINAMMKLKKDGKILDIGVGNVQNKKELEYIYNISDRKISSLQIEYNLFDRWAEEEFFLFCNENNIKIIAYSPLDKGRIYNGNIQKNILYEISTKYNKPISQIALNWIMKKKVIPIPKSSNIDHLRSNYNSLFFSLEDDDINNINKFCKNNINFIPLNKIKVLPLKGEGNKMPYSTLIDALNNNMDFSPSPKELSIKIKSGEKIKPVRVIKINEKGYNYALVEGRIRYWAYVIANINDKIPALIRENF